ncbi:hypothetical protein UFOVP584_60 [uncultured Caudovirales phage]|uniref:Uncharacterized protein n=1 Tax=uncultured Caudovirales phage TaxID=2100421 RepID=A0A6J5LTK9_9CAUD|nr:hypothetical protein UFOVP304_33 [uncultured Caudovirales phage]CAB4152198.1 hypothetical protein UFOVP584_60 [uncultured Caudovirales phage]
MGYYKDTTVEVTYNGKTTRVAKEDAHVFNKETKKVKEVKPKEEK